MTTLIHRAWARLKAHATPNRVRITAVAIVGWAWSLLATWAGLDDALDRLGLTEGQAVAAATAAVIAAWYWVADAIDARYPAARPMLVAKRPQNTTWGDDADG